MSLYTDNLIRLSVNPRTNRTIIKTAPEFRFCCSLADVEYEIKHDSLDARVIPKPHDLHAESFELREYSDDAALTDYRVVVRSFRWDVFAPYAQEHMAFPRARKLRLWILGEKQ